MNKFNKFNEYANSKSREYGKTDSYNRQILRHPSRFYRRLHMTLGSSETTDFSIKDFDKAELYPNEYKYSPKEKDMRIV